MKNIILGSVGCLIVIYTIVSCLSIYSISARRNEMENCIGQVLEQSIRTYYQSGKSDEEVETIVRQEIAQRLHSESQISIHVKACSMEQGILSVAVTEEFTMPGGKKKSLECEKTIIAE